jgi:uncharacterized protein
MSLDGMYRYRLLWVNLPVCLLALLVFWIASELLFPLPPQSVTITAGRQDGMYYQHAKAYVRVLESKGIGATVLESAGSGENLKRLRATPAQAEIGFVQGGFALSEPMAAGSANIQTVAQIDIEPVWIFSKLSEVDTLPRLQGLRVALGQSGSGSRAVASKLLEQVRLSPKDLVISETVGLETVAALREDRVDAAIFVAAPSAPVIQAMWQVPGIQLARIRHSAAFSERLPYLEPRLAPAGSLDTKARFPLQDTILLTTMASLIVREDMHPAVKRLLAIAAVELHSGSGPLHAAGDFPHLKQLEFPSAVEARRSLAYGQPWIEQTVGLQTAYWLYRLLLIGLPLGLAAWLVCRAVPVWLRWTFESYLNRWYGELKFIENDLVQPDVGGLDVARHHRQLRNIEQSLNGFRTPSEFNKRVVTLHAHIEFVRQQIYATRGR